MRFLKQNRWLRVLIVFAGFAAATFLPPASHQQEVFAAGDGFAAVYRNGSLEISIPYEETLASNRVLNLEVLDPNDATIAKLAHRVSPSNDTGSWRAAIRIDKSVAIEDLAWNRLKIRAGDVTKIVSLSEILHVPVVRLFAQRSYAAGSSASVRIITMDSKTADPLRNSRINIELLDGDQATMLFRGRTDSFGTAQVAFALPAGSYGPRQLRATAYTALGTVIANQPVQIERRDRILLTTDKPLYQPGQTIHLRALAFDGPRRRAAADQPITLEVEDARGNKVFKKRNRTDGFGIASADFQLADEVNFGPYHVRAILGDEGAQTTQEQTITVDRYVLPKFKIEIDLENDKAKKQSSYYLPGETVAGNVIARYLFGKPLANASVTVTLKTFDVMPVEVARISGKTDREGRFSFSTKLPDFFAGRSTRQGSAPVSIGAEVKDTAEHTQARSRDILVSNKPILIMAVPESGQLLPGLENRIYILTSYPDGSPAKTVVTGNITPERIETDASGVATVSLKSGSMPAALNLKATDERGRTARAEVELESLSQPQSLMLRTNKSIYRVGERLRLQTFSTRPRGAVYIDVVKNGQTLITRAIETKGGRGELEVHLTAGMFGTLEVRAYQINSDADPISDRRLVYIDPADDLKVALSTERESYRPGEDACINFSVTDKAGRPVSAALGIEIVDEAVFALSEKHPGFEKVFMYLEKELLKPRYEIHQFSFEDVLLDDFGGEVPARAMQRERAARVLLAAAGTVGNRDVRAEFGRDAIDAKRDEYLARYMNRIYERAQELARAMTSYYKRRPASAESFDRDLEAFAAESRAKSKMLEDPWGNRLRGEGRLENQSYLTLRSPGPDRRNNTADDIFVHVYAQRSAAGVKLSVHSNYALPGAAQLGAAAPEDVRRFRAQAMRGDEARKGADMQLPAVVKEKGRQAAGDRDFNNERDDQGGGPRVRSYFPETLYTNPALITDGQGRASIRVPVADSITTWRITSLASTARGALGSATYPVRVFQDFFIDLDLPVSITEGDMVSVPVAVYNYLPDAQSVTLELRQDPWFSLDEDTATKQVEVGAGKVTAAYFRIKASKIGEQQLQVTARLDGRGQAGDGVARSINVLPNGEERAVVVNERLEGAVTKDVVIPDGAIADASKIFVKFYPGALSQVVEGLDSILQMPGGCFEQTSSSTYPNVLVMDYLKTSKKITPEIQAKAEGFISLGYQRLVTFEVKGGGFSWFGQAPANKILTAYGLMEFSDMSRVHEVDPRLIERTQNWLASQQQPDGSFKPDASFINEGATNRYNSDVLRITAYIGWALATTGYKGGAVEKAKQFVTSRARGNEDAYTLAVIANFAADYGKDKAWLDSAIGSLAAKAIESQKTAYWNQEGETPTSARSDSADNETTALAAQALLKSGQKSGLAKKALDYLTGKKDAFGNWHTTQATILALKAFLLSFTRGTNADTAGTIEVAVDGKRVERVEITGDNNDLLHLVDLKAHTHEGAHRVSLSFTGKGSLQYQIVGRYYMPWSARPGAAREPLSIDVSYDRTRLAQDEIATARVRVQNNTTSKAKMIMVDLGIPPGFEIAGEDFEALMNRTREKAGGKLEKFTITAKQAILYFDGLNAKQRLEFSFRLRARFPVRAQTFSSRIYEYYNPQIEDKARPVEMTVVAK